jgi:hypothetical protein
LAAYGSVVAELQADGVQGKMLAGMDRRVPWALGGAGHQRRAAGTNAGKPDTAEYGETKCVLMATSEGYDEQVLPR